MNVNDLVSVDEAASALGLHRKTIYQMLHFGVLPRVLRGHTDRASLNKLIKQREQKRAQRSA